MNETTRGTVLGYDGSPDAELALQWAAVDAAATETPVSAVVVEDPDVAPLAAVETRHKHLVAMKDSAEIALKEHGVSVATSELRKGSPVFQLLDAAESAEQIVVGSRGHGRVAEAVLGSVSQAIARRASRPVVVVREAANPDSGRIVVGVDGSEPSRAALEFACRRAERTGEVVVAVHGWRIGELHVDRRGNLPADVGDKLDDKELFLAEAVAGVRSSHPDVILLKEAIPVSPKKALVDASSNASLVVVGTHGRGLLAGTALGSVSQHVLRHAHCPVAVIR